MTLAYEGTAYAGWQRQSHHPSVQQTLEEAIETILKQPVRVFGASRTDAGAHAKAQVANVHIQSDIPLCGFQKALNGTLPDDIAVTAIKEMSESFHARFDAVGRTYEYHILNQTCPDPLLAKRAYYVPRSLSLALMRQAAKIFVGTHDFSSMCRRMEGQRDAVRTIKRLSLHKENALMIISVTGNGFLRGMIRTMVQVLVEAGLGRRSPDSIGEMLDRQNRRAAPRAAPAHGLYLVNVDYPNDLTKY